MPTVKRQFSRCGPSGKGDVALKCKQRERNRKNEVSDFVKISDTVSSQFVLFSHVNALKFRTIDVP